MDNQQQYVLTFDNGSVADANRWASELKEYILDAAPDVEVEQQRDNSYSQDLGTTLVLILGTPAVLAVTQALGNWLTKQRTASITIKNANGEIIVTNVTNKDVMRLAERWLTQDKKV